MWEISDEKREFLESIYKTECVISANEQYLGLYVSERAKRTVAIFNSENLEELTNLPDRDKVSVGLEQMDAKYFRQHLRDCGIKTIVDESNKEPEFQFFRTYDANGNVLN